MKMEVGAGRSSQTEQRQKRMLKEKKVDLVSTIFHCGINVCRKEKKVDLNDLLLWHKKMPKRKRVSHSPLFPWFRYTGLRTCAWT